MNNDIRKEEDLVTEEMFIKKQRKAVTHHSMIQNHKTVSKEKLGSGMTHFSINAIMREVVFNKNELDGDETCWRLLLPEISVKNP